MNEEVAKTTEVHSTESRTGGSVGFIVFGSAMILMSLIPLWLGFDKILRYDEVLMVNAYVGNDQGNLMLNGMYSIGCFVLFAAGFVSGLISMGLSMMHQRVYG